ncbi:MAG: hypothetical protein V4690_01665 [Patescibacteria group bacterium]
MIKIYVALGIIVVAMGGFLFYYENAKETVAVIPEVVEEQVQEPVNEPVVAPKFNKFVFTKNNVTNTVEVASGWYIYNDDASPGVLFTKNEDLIIPQATEWNAVGPNFSVAVTNITDIAGVTTEDEWLIKQGYKDDPMVEGDPITPSEEVIINGYRMIRAVSDESGGSSGRTLVYVHFYDLQRIIIFAQWPYVPGSEITKVFEEMISKFVPSPRQVQ